MGDNGTDPFGGIRGVKAKSNTNQKALDPFEVDLNDALDGIKKSIDLWDGKGQAQVKGTLIERFRQRAKQKQEDPPNWNYVSEFDRDAADVYVKWAGRIVRAQRNIPRKQVRVALVGLLAFYSKIKPSDPDLSHPDIIRLYNLTAKHYGLEEADYPLDLAFNPSVHLDPFAGVRGKEGLQHNQFEKDLNRALEEVIYSVEFLDQIDVPAYRKEYRFKSRKPINLTQTYKTSSSYFDVHLWFPGGSVQTIENVPVNRARIALVSMKTFLEGIDTELPDLEDQTVAKLYRHCMNHNKPGQRPSDPQELKPVDEGGTSYWSKITHRWIKGRFNRKTNVFTPPEKGL